MTNAARRSQAEYDAAQTRLCTRMRDLLQSIAILAVQAQDLDPSGDKLGELLETIEGDLTRAVKIHTALNTDDVFATI